MKNFDGPPKVENTDDESEPIIPGEEEDESTRENEKANLFRQRFDEIKETSPDEALGILNEAIENELIDPSQEGDRLQDVLMHIFADSNNWEKVTEIISQTINSHSQKGRILYFELKSDLSYTGTRVKEKSVEDYSPDEIEKHEVGDYDSCIVAIRMEKFADVETYIQILRDENEIDTADHLTRELMDIYIQKKDFGNAKRVVDELTDKSESIKGRQEHLENLAGIPFEKI